MTCTCKEQTRKKKNKRVFFCLNSNSLSNFCEYITTHRSQREEYTRLLIFRKFSMLFPFIWAYPFINFQENFQLPSLPSLPSHGPELVQKQGAGLYLHSFYQVCSTVTCKVIIYISLLEQTKNWMCVFNLFKIGVFSHADVTIFL